MSKKSLIESILAAGSADSKTSLSKRPVADLEALLESLSVPDETDEAGSPEDAGTEVDWSEVGVGDVVRSGRKGHAPVEVCRIRIGKKHVTMYDEQERDVVWQPLNGGTVVVLEPASA